MSDFDQLIKEKINSKEYAYSAKNWQSFTKKAGWRRVFSLTHWLLTGAAVVVVAAGGGLAYWLWTGGKQPVDTRMQEQPTVEEATAPVTEMKASTVEISTEATTPTDITTTQAVTTDPAATNRNTPPKATQEESSMPAADTVGTSHTPGELPAEENRIPRRLTRPQWKFRTAGAHPQYTDGVSP